MRRRFHGAQIPSTCSRTSAKRCRDPGKDGAADVNLIKNWTQFLAEQGLDIHDVFATLEQKLAEQHNLNLDSAPATSICLQMIA